MDLLISASDSTLPIDTVLLERPQDLRIFLDGPLNADALTVLVFFTGISSFANSLTVELLPDSHLYEAERSYADTLLDVLVLNNNSISFEVPYVVTKGRVCVPTESLTTPDYSHFKLAIAKLLRHAEIPMPSNLLGLASRLAYETLMNAEEHGAFRIDVASSRNVGVPRVLGVIHHKSTLSYMGGNVASYVKKYLRSFPKPEGGWLELVVADGGMGVVFPSYFTAVQRRSADARDVYSQPFSVERFRLEQILERGSTTKGSWGRQISTQTRPGMGTEIIRQQFAEARAFATLRTGRSVVHSLYSDPHGEERWDRSPRYVIASEPAPCYSGTAWQLLIPLTSRYTMEL